jgi:hypothetical protein
MSCQETSIRISEEATALTFAGGLSAAANAAANPAQIALMIGPPRAGAVRSVAVLVFRAAGNRRAPPNFAGGAWAAAVLPRRPYETFGLDCKIAR